MRKPPTGIEVRGQRTETPRLWRSLDELAGSNEFQQLLEREFPGEAGRWLDPVNRRRFLHLLGASAALAGAVACTKQPEERLVPYVRAPENLIPGKPLYFASAVTLAGYAEGVLVESHEGRPTKIEGNPDHPASLGAAGTFTQAAVLELYDPDRLKSVTRRGRIRTWEILRQELDQVLAPLRSAGGRGLHLLCGGLTSPSVADQLAALQRELPEAAIHFWEAAAPHQTRMGARLAFGRNVSFHYDLQQADVLFAADADFLTEGPGAVRYARDFAARRRPGGERGLARLYCAESTPTATGGCADHRLSMKAASVGRTLAAVAARLGVGDPPGPLEHAEWTDAAAADLQANAGRSLIVVGESQPPEVHALGHLLNQQLGNVGRTIRYTEPIEIGASDHLESLASLRDAIDNETVEVLLIAGGNPDFDAPADLALAGRLSDIPFTLYLGLHDNETAAACDWVVPMSHELESWGDARCFDGTATVIQPLIEPLYGSRTLLELIATLRRVEGSDYDLVRSYWATVWPAGEFESRWRQALHDGVVAGSAAAPVQTQAGPAGAPAVEAGDGWELLFRPDPTIFDGRFANNGWLQELPKPLTKLTWDNAVLISPAAATELDVSNGQVVSLEAGDTVVEGPVWVLPGQAERSLTLHLGYGRRRVGAVGRGAGFDPYPLRRSDGLWRRGGVTVTPKDEFRQLACTQDHHAMEGRHLVREATVAEYEIDPEFAQKEGHSFPEELDLYSDYRYDGYAWGLTVDLNACTGCNACIVACQAENNIPVVGRDEVAMGREMHWIRIDRYFEGAADNPRILHQPVMCQHCEKAPCEVVCPVAATVHSDEGLNDMVYNRCVGTRYCSNNCPYKVRRFNFLLYADWTTESVQLQRNPDVSVRSRGVMEKCTYCVQRINEAKIQADLEDRTVADGEIRTACQQTCPSDAIVFGNINDPASRVATLKADPRNYGILTELNTAPRTTYLARLRNPNPALEGDRS